jgi:hypothetical protein
LLACQRRRGYSASKTTAFEVSVPATDRNAAGYKLLRAFVH